MVNPDDFKERLEKVRAHYNLTSTAFAEAIGVRPSNISHLLNGRNKPSLDFVLRLVRSFPEVELYWLLNGKGVFPATTSRQGSSPLPPGTIKFQDTSKSLQSGLGNKGVDRIVIFYEDGTFSNYLPE